MQLFRPYLGIVSVMYASALLGCLYFENELEFAYKRGKSSKAVLSGCLI